VAEAIHAERRRVFWQTFREAVTRAIADPAVAAEDRAEAILFEGTLLDGLEDKGIPR
jgi:hypothetical protein